MKINKFSLTKILLCLISLVYLVKSKKKHNETSFEIRNYTKNETLIETKNDTKNQNTNLVYLINSQNETSIEITNETKSEITNELKNTTLDLINDDEALIDAAKTLNENNKGFLDGFISGFSIVFFAEVGDRTFILIMIFSISNNYFKTFLISNLVLLSWNLLSILIGLNMQYYINRSFVEWFGIALFAIFGVLMIHDGFKMESKLVEEEFMEEEENLRKKAEIKYISNDNIDNDEERNVKYLKNDNDLKENLIKKNKDKDNKNNNKNLFDSIWAFGFALLMAEFGDKSQIAAIIIGATLNLYGVILGTSLAHLICSVIAIVFGRIFSHYITNRQITMIGGIIFLLFSLLFLIEKL